MKLFYAASTQVLLIVLMLLFGTTAGFGQVRSATISGTVQDGAGRVISDADVTVFETTTSQTYNSKTNSTGNFTVPYLPAGLYNVTVASKGFQTSAQQGIDLGNGQSINVSIALKVGTTEVVEVNTSGEGIQVDTATVQSAIGETAIASLPNISHNPLAYLALEAGVNTRGAGSAQANSQSFGIGIQGRRQISDFAINGAQAFENDIQLDGLSTQASGFNEVTIVPNQDAILEVRAIVNEYPAQYGRAHGVVQTTTKGGTDQYHGLLFLRNRSSVFQANAYSQKALPQPIPLSPSEIFTFGGSVGGPIKKTKAFFFVSYEGLFWNNPTHISLTVPTALERAGDFGNTLENVGGTATPLKVYDPFNVTQIAGTQNYTRALIPGDPGGLGGSNLKNSSMGISQYALNVLSNYPLPNHTPSDAFNSNNYLSTGRRPTARPTSTREWTIICVRTTTCTLPAGTRTGTSTIRPSGVETEFGTQYSPPAKSA